MSTALIPIETRCYVALAGKRGRYGKWYARIRGIHLGTFKNAELAAIAYDLAAIKYFGDFARTNF